jgi:multidrug efflux pump subunit AcrB
MVRPFYRNLRILILAIFLIVAWGVASFQSLPRQEDPELITRTAVVQTPYPGASADRVEALVTEVLETEINELETVKNISSTSRVGFSSISVELVDQVQDAQPIWSKVRDEMDTASNQFPPGAGEPELDEVQIKAYTIIPSLHWKQEGEPNYAILRRYAEELATLTRQVKGTEEVELFGAPDEEILVEISAPELVSVGLSPQELANRVSLSDAKVSAGQLRNPQNNLAVEVESELKTLEQIRRIPIQNSSEGQFTRLGDIARVDRGIHDPPQQLAVIRGESAVAVGILMKSGVRIDQYSQAIHEQLDKFRSRLPEGIELNVIFDQSGYVNERINSLIANLIFAAILVVAVVFVAMGWRSSLIVGTALPLTVCAVLGWMSIVGIPIHQMSVTGLIIALGLLIDNAIVIVNEIQSELENGAAPSQAVTKSVNYLQVPLFASTLTTVLTFLPIALLPGGAGEFVGSIAISVIFALISSLLISLTVVAALTGRMLNRAGATPSQGWWNNGISIPRLGGFYRWTLEQAARKPLLAIVLTLMIPVSGFLMAGTLERQFFPNVNRDQFQIEVEFSSDTAIAETKAKTQQASEILRQHSQVEAVNWFIGESAPKFYYNLTGRRKNQSHYAEAMVQLKSGKGVQGLVRTVQEELDRAFPEARFLVQQLGQGPPYNAPVEMRIYGPNLEELRRFGQQAREMLASIPEVTHVRDDLTEYRPKIGFQVDDEQIQQAGLTKTDIAQQLSAYLEGAVGGSILESTENLPVRVRLTDTERANLDEIASLDLRPQNQRDRAFRPNSAFGEFQVVPQQAKIARRNEQRVNTVQAFIEAGVLPSTVLNQFQQALEERNFELPPGYSYEWGGEYEESSEARGNLLLYVPLLVLVMITALVLSLNSFRQTLIMGMIAVAAIGMALFSLWVFNAILGFMAIVGAMGLVGIALNDSIVVLSALNEDEGASRGDPKAVREVVIKATRHVFTTTFTTMMGFVPLLIENDPFWRPLAIAIAGGISGSSLLALYFVPAMYMFLMHRLPRQLRKNKTASKVSNPA